MPALTRGPLPPSVYWRRRLVVLTVALLVFWAGLHLLGGGSSTPKASPTAATTSVSVSPTPGAASPSASASASTTASATVSAAPTVAATPTVLPSPSGACAPSDVSVSPSVTNAAAGSSVPVVLTLRAFSTPACTWHVGHKTMQVKITTAGGSSVWSTVQCPAALAPRDVVVYRDAPTRVTIAWSARRADSECSSHTAWAKVGSYRVTGVALGGVPDEASFTLGAPLPVTPAPTTPPASTSPTATPKTAGASTAPSTPASSAKPKKHKKLIAD